MEIIKESQGKRKNNEELLLSVVPMTNRSSDRDKLAKLLSNMTDEQCKKLLNLAEKTAS